MSSAKTAAQVTGEITRRLLPGYSAAFDAARAEQATQRARDEHRRGFQRWLVEVTGGDIARTREIALRRLDGTMSVEGWLTEHEVADGQDVHAVAVALYVPEPTPDGVFGRVALHVELPAQLSGRLCEAVAALRAGH